MRKKEKQIAEKRDVEDILRRAKVLRLAMCDEGRPYVLPLNFGYRDGFIFIHCAKEGRKLDILRSNPRVCFEASTDLALHVPEDPANACGFSMAYRCAIGEGEAEILMDPDEVEQGLQTIMEHYAEGPFRFRETSLDHAAVLRIRVDSLSGKQNLP